MAANGASFQIRSEIRIPQRDGMTSSPSHVDTPSEEPAQIVPLQQRPLQGPLRPTETPEDATPTGALIGNLIRTVQRQTSLIEEQNRCLMDLEQTRQLVRTKRTPSPIHSRRGRSPRQSRSRSPRHSISLRSPSYTRRSTRRRSPRRTPPRRSPPRRSPSRRSPPRRSPPRRNRRPWSSFGSEDTRYARNDRNAYGPFTRRIREAPIPRGLEKSPQMDSYDGTTNPDEHNENIEAVLTYRSVQGAVKCKLFDTTLRRGAVTWFKNLGRNSIDSWSDLCHKFTTRFSASRTQPKTVASLEAIVQGKSEPLRDYIERFNKEAVHVRGADETMKRYLIAKGLREGIDVKKVVRLDSPRTLNEFLAIAKIYIAYEEELYADSLNKSRKEEPAAESFKKREGKPAREGKRPNGHFTEYTPLAMSREKILAEIAVADLTEAGVKPPKALS
jgi:hypothetical protein